MPGLQLSRTDDHKLDAPVQAKVLTFLGKLQADDTTPGLHIEKMAHQRDPRARTGRVDQSWRAVLFRLVDDTGERLYVYAGTFEHDEACRRAQNRVLRTNPVTNIAEIITAGEPGAGVSTGDVVRGTTGPAAADGSAAGGRRRRSDRRSYLAEHGYPVVDLVGRLGFEEADALLLHDAADAEELAALTERFGNEWQRLAILGMAVGDTIDAIRLDLRIDDPAEATDELAEETPTEPAESQGELEPAAVFDPAVTKTIAEESEQGDDAALVASLNLPASRMQFSLVSDDAELERILTDGDFAAWRVFLHPQQQRYVDSDYRGPFRLTGGAGTGKTVVLVHRARRLAGDPAARVILTTVTKALAGLLERDLRRLDDTVPIAGALGESGVHIAGIDALAASVRQRAGAAFWAEAGEAVLGYPVPERPAPVSNSHGWDTAAAAVDPALGAVASPAFLEAEYAQVVLPQRITSLGGYLAARRPGRGTALDRRRREAVWEAVERYRANARAARELAWIELSALAVAWLALHPEQAPADHVLVDEGQDLSPLHWQLVRALVAPGSNDIFLAEDVHQRIYGQRIVLSRYGIATVGRSRRLRLNYRTTEENLRYALDVLEGAEFVDSADAREAETGYRSARRGPVPRAIACDNTVQLANAVADTVASWQSEGEGEAIAVLGRSTTGLRRLHRHLASRGVDATLYPAKVKPGAPVLVTMHSAKGLEFSRVILFDVSEGSVPAPAALAGLAEDDRADALLRERSLLYVAATRARDELVVTWAGEPSGLLR